MKQDNTAHDEKVVVFSTESTMRFTHAWVLAGIPLWGPLRAAIRLTAALVWLLLCYFLSVIASFFCLLRIPGAAGVRTRVSLLWVHGMRAIIGMRIRQIGTPPEAPYFLVVNHLTWGDLFAMKCLCRARFVLQADDGSFPLLGRLLRALNPVLVHRVREEVPMARRRMEEAIEQGDSLLMAPEGVVGPGKEVRRFRAALLDAAVRKHKPVHYASITYRTPKGCPPPSQAVLFGPDPYFRTPDGKIPQSELDAWGPERSFLPHFLRLLALPWHEVTIHFAPTPIWHAERIALANHLQAAVQKIFVPVE